VTVQGSGERGGFIDIPRGEFARFAGTTVTCVSPKGQIPGGHVACDVDYVRWRNIFHPVPTTYVVGLTLLRCVDVTKWSRGGGRMLKSTRLC
jgi:hypothetical protein